MASWLRFGTDLAPVVDLHDRHLLDFGRMVVHEVHMLPTAAASVVATVAAVAARPTVRAVAVRVAAGLGVAVDKVPDRRRGERHGESIPTRGHGTVRIRYGTVRVTRPVSDDRVGTRNQKSPRRPRAPLTRRGAAAALSADAPRSVDTHRTASRALHDVAHVRAPGPSFVGVGQRQPWGGRLWTPSRFFSSEGLGH